MRRPRSIRTRLLLALMLMTLLTLTIATGLSALMDLKLFRDHMLRDLQVLAAVVGENCISALVFDSPTSAERNLTTLAREYQVQSFRGGYVPSREHRVGAPPRPERGT